MRKIEKILSEIETCIKQGTFKNLEHDKLDLKYNSHDGSDWKEVFKTACAFLNTNGGILLIGIYEDEKNKNLQFQDMIKEMKKRLKV